MESMKIIGIAALALLFAAPLGTAKADPWKDESGNGRGWREHSRHWDGDRDEHHSRRGNRDWDDRHSRWGDDDHRDRRHSRDWDRDRDYRGYWDRNQGGYGSSYSYGYGGQYPWYGR